LRENRKALVNFNRQTSGVFISVLLLIFLTSTTVQGVQLTGEEIMNRVDENQFIASARMESEMIIRDRGREIIKEMISYVESDGASTSSLSEFTNPRDRGTKFLLISDELWMYFPDAEDLVRISGHMLNQRMMGSDFSYQDALESEKLSDLYTFAREGEDELGGVPVYVVKATAREGAEVSYHSRRLWIDVEKFVILREEMYARDGRLLKVMTTDVIEEISPGRWMPTVMIMEDKLRQDSQTVFRLNSIDLDYVIPDGLFSLESLQ